MTPPFAACLLALSVVVTLGAAGVFARRLDQVGLRLGFPEVVLGLLTALAADAPEASSAIAALFKGEHGVAVGVVVGSNVFNIAAMLGLSAVLVAGLHARHEALLVEAVVALWIAVATCAMLAGSVGPTAALLFISLVVVPYIGLLLLGPGGIRKLHLGVIPSRFLRRTFGEGHPGVRPRPSREEAVLRPTLLLLAALSIIVVGSAGMVKAAIDLANDWAIPHALVGVLPLAILTSLPNAWTGVRFGIHRRGSALMSETLNSNSINLIVGLAIPATIVSFSSVTALTVFDLAWLILMTAAALAFFSRVTGARRWGGGVLIALYVVFGAVQIVAAA